jgi:hypothetical protein
VLCRRRVRFAKGEGVRVMGMGERNAGAREEEQQKQKTLRDQDQQPNPRTVTHNRRRSPGDDDRWTCGQAGPAWGLRGRRTNGLALTGTSWNYAGGHLLGMLGGERLSGANVTAASRCSLWLKMAARRSGRDLGKANRS